MGDDLQYQSSTSAYRPDVSGFRKIFPVILRSTISLPCLISLMLGKWGKPYGRWQGPLQRSITFLSPKVDGNPHQKEH